ncbi:hypothetical protein JHK85_046991 [Glycine max]|nr:hypothetical protein JHK85_046991 [Glycine max]
MNSRQASPSPCDICGATQTLSLTIHNIRYRAHTCRYCTNCVLKQHPGLFCPLCFELHDDSPLPPHHRLMCVRCPAVAHRSCAFPSTNVSAAPAPAPPFFCPSCLDSNFTYFKLPDRKSGAVDVQSAKVLVTAARIAAVSMSKAAAAARYDAERRAREAAVARKRAKDALEHLAEILAREQAEQDEEDINEQNGIVSAGRRRGASPVIVCLVTSNSDLLQLEVVLHAKKLIRDLNLFPDDDVNAVPIANSLFQTRKIVEKRLRFLNPPNTIH